MSKGLYKETVSENRQVMSENRQVARGRFSMLPADILERKDIAQSSKILLAVMNMESRGKGYLCFSDSLLSDKTGISRSQIVFLRTDLEKHGLIEKDGDSIKQIQPYRLLHPDMRPSEESPEEPLAPMSARVTKPICPQCKIKKRKVQTLTGICKACEHLNALAATGRRHRDLPAHEVKSIAKLSPLERRVIEAAQAKTA
jgi:hypothetical protein